MSPDATAILQHLGHVAALRAQLAQQPALAAQVQAIKAYQHRRFEHTYADLLAAGSDTRNAALFFLSDLYGSQDFSARDAQFARIVPALDRLFPTELVHTVCELAELHDLSETLDRRMGEARCQAQAGPAAVDAAAYVDLWCSVAAPEQRERQVALMLAVGQALVGYTRNRLLRHALRMMGGPARLAGLEAFHGFLERGFETFRALPRPQAFLDTIAQRERALSARLFTHPVPPPGDLP